MKNKLSIPYFFDKNKSEFCKEDFESVSPKKFHFGEKLTQNLENNLFVYRSKTNNAFFYFVNSLITINEELAELHLRFFSEDKADFYAVKTTNKNNETGIELVLAKTTFENKKTIAYIPENNEDEELLKTINKTSIDTGTFWIYYKDILQKAKVTNVRDKLVEILSELRTELKQEIKDDNDDKYVQALIDRTLFIKFLEDRHIINSYFFGEDVEYKNILKSQSPEKVNDLFFKIQEIFNNYLFAKPDIKLPESVLSKKVLKIIQNKIEGVKNGQLTLFDYKFDIIPIEAISLIYEIFIDNRREKGAYYTAKQLTNFITEKTIDKNGKIIDFACGSGSFLISAYKRLLQLDEKNKQFNSIKEKIDYRIELLKNHIYGIEREETARRLAVFSMYLSLLDDLSPKENEELKELLKNEKNYPLFTKNIGENIICSDFFASNKFDNEKFDFVIGNPPWKKDFEKEKDNSFVPAINYLNENKEFFSGKRELSELFLHKAKNWETGSTRYGFVVNTSNFTNQYSKFQDFFYKTFNIENFYDISDLDEIFTASEPAIVCIYTGKKQENNKLILNVLKSNEFSKLFKTIFVSEDDNIEIIQNELIKTNDRENIPLRNFLVGKDGDFSIINYLESNRFEKFENYILRDENGKFIISEGITVWGEDAARKKYGISKDEWKKLSENWKKEKSNEFHNENIKEKSDINFNIQYIKRKDIVPFFIKSNSGYMKEDRSIFHRGRADILFLDKRILFSRLKSSRINAVYIEEKLFTQDSVFTIRLNENAKGILICAILNSKIIDYYSEIQTLKRIGANYQRNNTNNVKEFPFPKNKNPEIVKQIEDLSRQFTDGEIEFEAKEHEFNELIFDLYRIGLIERQRINDFFIKDGEKVKKEDLENYANEFCEYLEDDLLPEVKLHKKVYTEENLVKGISVVKIYLGKEGEKYPEPKNVSRFLLTDILKNVYNENILSLRSRIYAENTIYIIKDNLKKNWTLTKAGEDAIAELNKINKHNSKNK